MKQLLICLTHVTKILLLNKGYGIILNLFHFNFYFHFMYVCIYVYVHLAKRVYCMSVCISVCMFLCMYSCLLRVCKSVCLHSRYLCMFLLKKDSSCVWFAFHGAGNLTWNTEYADSITVKECITIHLIVIYLLIYFDLSFLFITYSSSAPLCDNIADFFSLLFYYSLNVHFSQRFIQRQVFIIYNIINLISIICFVKIKFHFLKNCIRWSLE